MKFLLITLLGTLIVLAPVGALAADPPPGLDACKVMPMSNVAKRVGKKLASEKAVDFMDAMRIYQCNYSIQGDAGLIGFIVMDFSQPNPDPSMQVGGPHKPGPKSCNSMVVKRRPTILCMGDGPDFGVSFSGPMDVLTKKDAQKLVDEAIKSWKKQRKAKN